MASRATIERRDSTIPVQKDNDILAAAARLAGEDLCSIADLSSGEVRAIVKLGHDVKCNPREYRHALFTFADHPLAVAGLARLDAARGDLAGALAGYTKLQASAPMPEYAARMAEIEAALGRSHDAARHFALAEQGWRSDMPEPAHLARLLARDRGRAAEALRVAEQAAAERQEDRKSVV